MSKKPVRVAVTGAAGQIGYALLFRIASGEMLGKDQPVILQLLEVPVDKAQEALKGVMMELEDCAFPLLAGMEAHSDPMSAFKDTDYALLVRRQGKGTFVATHAEQQIAYRFLRLMPDGGGALGMERRLLDCRRTRAPADVARALAGKSGDAVVQLRRLLVAAAKPVVLDEIWLPGKLFKGLTAERLADYKGPMYGMFEAEFGVRMIRAEEKIRAVLADTATAQLLALKPGAPLLSVERLSFTYGDKPVELRRGLYSTEQHFYRNELN